MTEAGYEKIIISYKDLDVKLTQKADENIQVLLDNTVLGTKGGMRYQLLNIKDKIAAYRNNIRFVSLYKRDKLTGTIGFCYRKIMTAGNYFHSSYLRYFAFMPIFQAALNSKGFTGRQRPESREETWKDKVLAFFRKPQMLDFPGYEKDEKHVVYAYIESMNERSKNFIQQVGFEHIRTFLTVAFSRFKPVKSGNVSKLQANEVGKMKRLLAEFYRGHSFYSDEFSFCMDKFYVLKEDEEIIAGLSVVPSSFNVVHMPGVWGWIFMRVLPYTPLFRRLFQPEELRFLVFESFCFKEGREKSLEILMESVCAVEGYHLGLTWIDDRSELYDIMRTRINLGALNRMLNAKPGLVYANFINFSDTDKEVFFNRPAFISGFDFT
ncbi:MAG: hypothetical protein JW965_05680 [Bacteroidales bacterium]|nr:hypothetical protein [Bacteroidales bacterium]